MKDEAKKLTKAFVKQVQHRMVDLEWNARDLCRAAEIGTPTWSEIKSGKKSPSIDSMVRVARAVGIELQFLLKPKP